MDVMLSPYFKRVSCAFEQKRKRDGDDQKPQTCGVSKLIFNHGIRDMKNA
jgi:hypothetical protein